MGERFGGDRENICCWRMLVFFGRLGLDLVLHKGVTQVTSPPREFVVGTLGGLVAVREARGVTCRPYMVRLLEAAVTPALSCSVLFGCRLGGMWRENATLTFTYSSLALPKNCGGLYLKRNLSRNMQNGAWWPHLCLVDAVASGGERVGSMLSVHGGLISGGLSDSVWSLRGGNEAGGGSGAEEGEGSGNPSEPQPPPSIAQPTHEEPIPNIESSSPQKT
ncbi:hypothetical protein Tco_0407261 [Tanacetum coccineum]